MSQLHGARRRLAVLEELREVLILEQAEELQVEEEQLHLRVADALADAEAGAVDAVGAELEGPDARSRARGRGRCGRASRSPIVGAGAGDDVLRELDQVAHAVGRRVADGVAEAEARGAVIDRRA